VTYRVIVRTGPDVAHYPPGATFGPRTLRDFEFVWLLRGSARWCEGATSLDLRPGTLLLARPGMRDQFSWDRHRASVHAYVHFSLVGELPASMRQPDMWPLTRELSSADPLGALCRYALWLGRHTSANAVARRADVLSWLLDLFLRGPLPSDDDGDLPPHLARLADRLRTSWRSDGTCAPSLRELAAAARVSPGHLCRLFRREYGIGPVAAIELVRLARAATLLQRSNLTVAAVATTCGFANPFHFTRRFRHAYGVPPRVYRATHAVDDPLAPLARVGLLPLAHRLLLEDA
jgi:AraC family transcriptional regulator